MVDAFVPALVLGLLGAGHCLGMCGGFAAALSYAIGPKQHIKRIALLTAYNVGRISSYAVLGGIVAAGQNWMPDSGLPIARTVAGLLLIATAFYLADLWKGIVLLEKGGRYLWRYLQPLSQALLPVHTVPKALLLGAIWGWLPCGLVYSVLTLAAVQPSALEGAVTMAAFGIGTFWAVMAGGLAATWVRDWLTRGWVRRGLALAFGLFGLWTIAVPWYHLSHHGHHAVTHGKIDSHGGHVHDTRPQEPAAYKKEAREQASSAPSHEHHHH